MSDMNRFVSAYTAIVENATGTRQNRMLAHPTWPSSSRNESRPASSTPIEKMSSPVAASVSFSFSPLSRAGNTVAPTSTPAAMTASISTTPLSIDQRAGASRARTS